jgi:hypothetical protein
MADPRHEYIAGKVRGFHTRVTALDAPLDERARRFASAPVADASPGAFPARFRHKCVFPSFRANARDRHRPRRDHPSPRDFETDLRDQNPKTPAVPIDRWRNRSAYRRRKPSRAYSASPREPSRGAPEPCFRRTSERVKRGLAPASRTRPLLLSPLTIPVSPRDRTS